MARAIRPTRARPTTRLEGEDQADAGGGLVFAVARPVPGIGIVTPSLVAALVAIWLGGDFVAAVAYVAADGLSPRRSPGGVEREKMLQ